MFGLWDQQVTGWRGIPREYRAVQTPDFSGKSSQNLGAFQESKQSCPQVWMSSKPFFKASFPPPAGKKLATVVLRPAFGGAVAVSPPHQGQFDV